MVVSYPVLVRWILRLGSERNKKRGGHPGFTPGTDAETVPAGVGEHDFLQWENDSCLGRGLVGATAFDLRLPLNREDHLVLVIDQIRS